MTSSQPIKDINEHNMKIEPVTDLDSVAILDRVKELLGMATDADLARRLKEPPKTIGTWKYRNAIPYRKLILFCVQENMDLNYILTGDKNRLKPESTDFQELAKVIDEITSIWGSLNTISRFELASKLLRSVSEYKTSSDKDLI